MTDTPLKKRVPQRCTLKELEEAVSYFRIAPATIERVQRVLVDGEPVTFPIVFRTWRPEYLYVEEGWRVVNEKNADPEQEGSDTTK